MKTEEDEAFDELAAKQGHWNGGFMAKRAMAVDKLQEPVVQPAPGYCKNCKDYTIEEPLYAQPAQEPVALVIDGVLVKSALPEKYTGHLYITPPQREWVGLTDDETMLLANQTSGQNWGNESHIQRLRKTIENKLKEKNT